MSEMVVLLLQMPELSCKILLLNSSSLGLEDTRKSVVGMAVEVFARGACATVSTHVDERGVRLGFARREGCSF